MLRSFFALLLLSGTASSGNAYNGLDLLRGCNYAISDPAAARIVDVMESGRCVGYIAGVVDANSVVTAIRGKGAALFCLPTTGLQNEQLMRVVLKHLQTKPETLHEPARVAVVLALAGAFPCQ